LAMPKSRSVPQPHGEFCLSESIEKNRQGATS
jgi:hypothetical protein